MYKITPSTFGNCTNGKYCITGKYCIVLPVNILPDYVQLP